MSKLVDSKLNPGFKAVQVEKGDTLSQIALDHGNGLTYKQLAGINDIPNPDLIYIGQIIELRSPTTGDSVKGSTTKATIQQFGIQSNTENTLFATWSWNKPNTENYKVQWTYDTGDEVWFIGSDSTTEHLQSTYSIPDNAKRVRFRVCPISKTKTSNDKETSYWTANWSEYKIHNVSDNPPVKPGTPDVEIDQDTLTLTATLDNLDVNATKITFQVIKDNKTTYKTGTVTISTGHASFSCKVDVGAEYKVRCKSVKDKQSSEWSEYSGNISTKPAAPSGITTIRANSKTEVYLAWTASKTADSYEIEYATKKEYLGNSNQSTTQQNITGTSYTLGGLETGHEYFFRVRAIKGSDKSEWSGVKSVIIGKKPAAPTTWSSTTTVMVGEPLILYWVHNSEDGSKEVSAQLEYTVDGTQHLKQITKLHDEDEDEEEKTSSYNGISTGNYTEGTEIQWRVRTRGVLDDYGEWSVMRTVKVYAVPTLALALIDGNSNPIDTVTSFPVYVSAIAGPSTQQPIGYHLSVVSNEVYETVDAVGNPKTVNKGEEVYSKYFDINDALMVMLSANNIELENGVDYTVKVRVSMNSGLTAEDTTPMYVSWADETYEPNAEISVDEETLVAYIRPYCNEQELQYYKVTKSGDVYTATTERVNVAWGAIVSGVTTTNGKQVYSGILGNGTELYYYISRSDSLVSNISLSVYRREFDGTFVEIATGLDNSKNTCVTDPHPALDVARYRIVAKSNITSSISYSDVRGYSVGEKAVIIQWNENWTNFESTSEDALAEPPWSGSLLRLPYNIDVSDSRKPDVALVEYIGRSHPTSYYGTQTGETATWSIDIPKNDKETLYALRRLAIWMGDVYVREPSGSGYWANVTVSFSQKHCETVIPVSLSITRVEGGI